MSPQPYIMAEMISRNMAIGFIDGDNVFMIKTEMQI